MHKIADKEFTLEDFSCEHLLGWNDNFNAEIVIDYGHTPDGYPSGIVPIDILNHTIAMLNSAREKWLEYDRKIKGLEFSGDESIFSLKEKQKIIWWQMIQLLPSSYNQTRNVMMNYEVLCNIYRSRKGHRLDEWREFCSWIETLPYSELITGAAGSLKAKCMFSEPFPWTKEAGERLKAETDGIIKAAIDKELHNAIIPDSNQSSFSVKDLEEAMKHYDPNDGVKTHVTMMKED